MMHSNEDTAHCSKQTNRKHCTFALPGNLEKTVNFPEMGVHGQLISVSSVCAGK